MTGQDIDPRDNTTVGLDTVIAARPVVLIRVRPGQVAESARVVHLAPLPGDGVGVVTTLCGALLRTEDCESPTPGQGMPCDRCLASHLTGWPPPDPAQSCSDITNLGTGARSAALGYRSWGWPVLLRRDQVWLSLTVDAVALVIPTPLATDVAALLAHRRCPPAVLAHPDLPDHQVLLSGERYGPPLPWSPDVHRVTDAVPLPPSSTAGGPLTWVRPPGPGSLKHCREIDVATALRALREPPSSPLHF